MGVYPRQYKKEEFIKFLEDNNVKSGIVRKFKKLPEVLNHKNTQYKLNIISTWYSIGNTFYNFELNYYCEEKIEFLFSYKVFNDVELSVNNLIYELRNIDVLDDSE